MSMKRQRLTVPGNGASSCSVRGFSPSQPACLLGGLDGEQLRLGEVRVAAVGGPVGKETVPCCSLIR